MGRVGAVVFLCVVTLMFAAQVNGQVVACRPGPQKVLVLSNRYADTVAADFAARMPSLTFSSFDVSQTTPTLAQLNEFDAVLLFE